MDFTPHHKNRRGLKNQAEYLRRQKQQRRNNLTLRFILPVCGALFPSPTHISDASHAITRSLSPFVPPPASPSLSNSSFLFPASPAQHDPSLLFLPPRGSTPFHPLNAYFRPATPQPFYFVAELDLSASNLPQWAPANGKLFLPVFFLWLRCRMLPPAQTLFIQRYVFVIAFFLAKCIKHFHFIFYTSRNCLNHWPLWRGHDQPIPDTRHAEVSFGFSFNFFCHLQCSFPFTFSLAG